MTRNLRRLAAVLCAGIVVAACSPSQDPPTAPPSWTPHAGDCPSAVDNPVTLIVGARMGSQRPNLPDQVRSMVVQAMAAGQKVQVIRLDGQPSVAMSVTPKITAQNQAKHDNDVKNLERQFFEAIDTLQPKAPEADVLAALTEAGDVTAPGGTVVLVDSGVATAGQLTFRSKGMFGANPQEIADSLDMRHQLPSLPKMSVVLVAPGKTAEPQAELNQAQRTQVASIWEAVAVKAGAVCKSVIAGESHRGSFDTTVKVSTVDLPVDPPPSLCGTTTYDDSSSVGFVPDEATFRDPDAAQQALKQLVDKVSGKPVTMNLVGNTARAGNSEPDRVALAKSRAEAVKAVLVRLGVPDAHVTTEGAGSAGKYYKPDLNPDGSLDPVKASANRSVVVEMSCSG